MFLNKDFDVFRKDGKGSCFLHKLFFSGKLSPKLLAMILKGCTIKLEDIEDLIVARKGLENFSLTGQAKKLFDTAVDAVIRHVLQNEGH